MKDFDVIIIGGGVSGAVAGIASAREGAKTLIIEKMGFLGGALTASGVGPMMTFHAGDNQVIRGIAGEIIDTLKEMGGSPGHIIDTTGYTYTVTPFDSELMKYVLEDKYSKAGGELLYHSFLSGVVVEKDKIKSVRVTTKSGELNFSAKTFIDGTGDGDLSALAGVEFQLGRKEDNLCQPVTMNLKLRNIDMEMIKSYILENPMEFRKESLLMDKAPRMSVAGFVTMFKEAQSSGEISFNREVILFFETNNPGEVIVNTTRIQRIDATNSWDLSKAETEGRRQAIELFNYLKKRVPGFEKAVIVSTGPNIGIRESRKIKGKYTITAEDLFNDVHFEDEIARGGYPIDVHSPDGEGTNSKHLAWGASYGIPFRVLINEKVDNLITVGRCISSTQEANAAIRVSPIAMAVGHAGGIAAALASRMYDGEVNKIDYEELRNNLKKNGAYLK
jgi:hypothetical protein